MKEDLELLKGFVLFPNIKADDPVLSVGPKAVRLSAGALSVLQGPKAVSVFFDDLTGRILLRKAEPKDCNVFRVKTSGDITTAPLHGKIVSLSGVDPAAGKVAVFNGQTVPGGLVFNLRHHSIRSYGNRWKPAEESADKEAGELTPEKP